VQCAATGNLRRVNHQFETNQALQIFVFTRAALVFETGHGGGKCRHSLFARHLRSRIAMFHVWPSTNNQFGEKVALKIWGEANPAECTTKNELQLFYAQAEYLAPATTRIFENVNATNMKSTIGNHLIDALLLQLSSDDDDSAAMGQKVTCHRYE